LYVHCFRQLFWGILVRAEFNLTGFPPTRE
jgi:hypothetical protein